MRNHVLVVLPLLWLLLPVTCPAAGLRLSGDILLHLLGEEPPLGGEVVVEMDLPKPFSTATTPRYKVMINDWKLETPWLRGVFQAQAQLANVGDSLRLEHFSCSSDEAIVRLQGRDLPPTPLLLTGQADKHLKNNNWKVTHLQLQLGKALQLQGQAGFAPDSGLQATLVGEAPQAKALQQLLTPLLPELLRGAGATGSLGLVCELKPDDSGGLRLLATMQPRRLRLWDAETAGELTGLARLELATSSLEMPENMPRAWRLEGSLALPGGAHFKGLRLDLALAGGADAAHIEKCLLRPHAQSTSKALNLKGNLLLSPEKGVRLQNLLLQGDNLGDLQGDFSFDAKHLLADLQGKGLKLAGLLRWLDSFWPAPLQDWNPQGSLDVTLQASGSPDAPKIEASFAARKTGFASPDGNILAEGLHLDTTCTAALGNNPELSLNFSAPSGAALYKTFFLDLAVHPASVKLTAGLPANDNDSSIALRNMRAGLKGLGLVLASGSLRPGKPWKYDITASASRLELEKLFTTFVKDPLAMSSPAMAQAQASGGAGLEVRATGAGGKFKLQGRLDLVNAGFSTGPEGLGVEHMNLELPFSHEPGEPPPSSQPASKGLELQWGVDDTPDAPAGIQAGSLFIGRLRTPLGEMERMEMPVWLGKNQFGLAGDIELPVFGGSLQIRDIRVYNPLSNDFQLECHARLKGLDFAAIGSGPVPLQGSLAGNLGLVSLTREEMRTSGELKGKFFGGGLRIQDIGIRRPLTAGRRLLASAHVERMVMERFSQALNLGVVSGRLNIDLQNLEVAYNEPVAFHLEALSVPVDDVPQKISLKAVNAISVMGTGQGLTGAGVGMFASFFKSFSYEGIGMACDLKNDIFRVRGLINEGGVEYLIKKPSLFGINVINANPDNQISFSDMKKRLERVLHMDEMKVSGPAYETKEALP